MQRHEIPTHLNVPDRFLFGLTTKQVMQLIAGASCGYALLNDSALPLEAQIAAAAVASLVAVLVALVRPGGRAVEEWACLAVCYLCTPRRMVWRPRVHPVDSAESSWSGLSPRIGWLARDGREIHVR